MLAHLINTGGDAEAVHIVQLARIHAGHAAEGIGTLRTGIDGTVAGAVGDLRASLIDTGNAARRGECVAPIFCICRRGGADSRGIINGAVVHAGNAARRTNMNRTFFRQVVQFSAGSASLRSDHVAESGDIGNIPFIHARHSPGVIFAGERAGVNAQIFHSAASSDGIEDACIGKRLCGINSRCLCRIKANDAVIPSVEGSVVFTARTDGFVILYLACVDVIFQGKVVAEEIVICICRLLNPRELFARADPDIGIMFSFSSFSVDMQLIQLICKCIFVFTR